MKRQGKANQDFETARAVESAASAQDDTITLSSGVVLRGRKTNPVILVAVMSAFPRPEPPTVFMQQMGREMENPDDPGYIERLQAWKMDFADRMVTAMISLGTEIVSTPKGMGSPEKNDWLADYSLLGMPVHPEHKGWRYLTWVKFVAMKDEADMQKIQEVVGRLNGVRESAVKSAENFPGSDQTDR
ncbi:MAG: hypothetical protein EHM33_01900 [Chloroflexi bacterium]|nr:MAG: hypothetical protein EHM33_01900 [Chloroflexota bacterium]